MSNGFGHYWSEDSGDGAGSIAEAHQQSGVARSYVEVVDVESPQTKPLRAHGNGEKRNCRGGCGSQVATEQEKHRTNDDTCSNIR